MPLAAAAALAAAPLGATVDKIAADSGFAGEILIGKGDKIVLNNAYGAVAPSGKAKHQVGAHWRLASITKQVTATLFLKAMEEGRVPGSLDTPIDGLGDVTWRMLLTHRSGLPNPDETPKDAAGVPAFYNQPLTQAIAHCSSRPGKPGADFAYNNCDYLVLGGAVMGRNLLADPQGWRGWPAGMTMARPGELGVPGFVAGKPEPRFRLDTFSTSGGLIGTARDVFRFDRQLMTGKLLSPAARALMWTAEGGRSYQALGQWVFPGKLEGCADPVQIVQRDGEIQGVQARNFILPDKDVAVVLFTNRSSDDFALGEVWQGKGFVYDLLSAAACPTA
ncbi:serine hydrolase domain-containing protein [Sphingomonas rosea]